MNSDTFGRLVRESGDLEIRTHALQDFFGSDDHYLLCHDSQELLAEQLDLMIDLGRVLRARIKLERQACE
jgi:hypothetical protein